MENAMLGVKQDQVGRDGLHVRTKRGVFGVGRE
jgi:hypothetical protein